MAKDALYFSHDSNARHDPKITAMRAVYGSEGYGWFWMLVEMMRESEEYKLDMRSKYAFHAYAMQLQCDSNAFASFVHDCIDEFCLFSSDGDYFWSETLLRRMEKMQIKSQKAAESANARWDKRRKNANASNSHANVLKNDAIKEIKEKKESKEIKTYSENTVELTNHLIELMKLNNPNVKIPTSLDKWNDEMDKLERIDKYNYMQIRSVIDWCQKDNFWKGNILSVPKLREKMGTLIMQMKRTSGKVTPINKLDQMLRDEEEKSHATNGYYQTGTDPFS